MDTDFGLMFVVSSMLVFYSAIEGKKKNASAPCDVDIYTFLNFLPCWMSFLAMLHAQLSAFKTIDAFVDEKKRASLKHIHF